eukprot:5878863-Alexandrium_andersonii.AAC.1
MKMIRKRRKGWVGRKAVVQGTTWGAKWYARETVCGSDGARTEGRMGRHTQGRLWAVSYTHLTLPTICSV